MIDRFHFYLPGWEIPKNSKDFLTDHYGFVTDYLAEAFRALRKQNRFDAVERHFRFGSHVEGRDATAVRKTVSGLLKLLHPDGEYTKDELREYVELAARSAPPRQGATQEARLLRVLQDQLLLHRHRGRDGAARSACPSRVGKGAISQDPLPPGTVYTAAADAEGKVALYRLEVTLTAGTGKVRTPAGLERGPQGVAEPRRRATYTR